MDTARRVRALARFTLSGILVLGAGIPNLRAQQRPALTPTRLEAFASQPDAKTTWSKFVGRLDGGTAYVTVSAVTVESPTSEPRIMRGIRIEPRHEGPRPSCGLVMVEWSVMCDRELATAYVEESRLDELRASVLKGGAEVHAGHPSGITYYRASSGGSGLIVLGYTLRDRTLEEFGAIVATAMAELKNAPR